MSSCSWNFCCWTEHDVFNYKGPSFMKTLRNLESVKNKLTTHGDLQKIQHELSVPIDFKSESH